MPLPKDFFEREVTKESVEEYISDNYKGAKPHKIEGIPEGFSFELRKGDYIGQVTKISYLLGFTPGYKWHKLGAMFYKPIVVNTDYTKEQLAQEYETQEAGMLKLYKDNLSKI